MQGLNKTKAALQGRQCNYKKLKPSQITTLIDQVNNLGRVKGCSEVSNGYKLTAPLAQFNRDTRKLAHTGNSTYLKSFAGGWVSPKLDGPIYTQPIGVCLLPLWGSMAMADTQIRYLAAGGIPPSKQNHGVMVQPFGSISRCLSSFLIMRFIQAANDSSPSCRWASSIKSRSSGSSRNWNGGLPRLSFLCVDTLSTPDVMCLCVMTHYMHMNEKATPRSAETLPRRLTTNDRISIEVAMLNHTQTRPKYQYRFLALHRSDRSAAPCRLSVEAFTEKEARQVLSAHFILSLAARLPVREVRHA